MFPELRDGERLRRVSVPAMRATLRSQDGKVLAAGPADARTSPLVGIADSIAGRMEPQEAREERAALYARGFPADWPVGQSGLEEAFEQQLRGRPGGELVAGNRVLARAKPRPARAIRTTIHTGLQEAAVVGLAGRLGRRGRARPAQRRDPGARRHRLLGPAAARLDLQDRHHRGRARGTGLVKPSHGRSRSQSHAIIDGVELENANGEFCGGTFRDSFAHSCNSVFAPLGLKIGAPALVDVAERFGWNAPATIPGEVPSTLPPAADIDSPLEVASTAIGQFETLPTPLQMAYRPAGVAMRGVRHPPPPGGPRAAGQRVLSRRIARAIGSLIVDMVAYGTGTAAAIPGIRVAGKTGTASWRTLAIPRPARPSRRTPRTPTPGSRRSHRRSGPRSWSP